jgi:hypothetical protein
VVVVQGAVIRGPCASFEQLYKWNEFGINQRHVASTAMNAESSRSHLLFSVLIEVCRRLAPAVYVCSNRREECDGGSKRGFRGNSLFASEGPFGLPTLGSVSLTPLSSADQEQTNRQRNRGQDDPRRPRGLGEAEQDPGAGLPMAGGVGVGLGWVIEPLGASRSGVVRMVGTCNIEP